MSNLALTWAWGQDVSDPTAKLLLIKIADQANDDGVCWPSRRTLATHIGVSIRTIVRKAHDLEAAGVITIEPRTHDNGAQGSNLYCLQMHPPRDTPVTPPVSTVAPLEPSVEPSVEPFESVSNETLSGGDILSPPAPAPRKPRKRDLVWDAFDAIWGRVGNDAERSRRSKAVKLARQSLAGDEVAEADALTELRARHANYCARYDHLPPPSDVALVSRWSECAQPPPLPGANRPTPRRYGRGMTTAEMLDQIGRETNGTRASSDVGSDAQRGLSPGHG